jgi:hypothetical protein
MLEFYSLEFWAFVIFGYLACIVIAYLVTLKRYKREMEAFENGIAVDDKHKVSCVFESTDYDVEDEKNILLSLEGILNRNRFIWTKKEKSYCCFHGLVLQARLKCMINIVNAGNGRFRLVYSFYDRFISPVMITYVKNVYKKKMKILFLKIDGGIEP